MIPAYSVKQLVGSVENPEVVMLRNSLLAVSCAAVFALLATVQTASPALTNEDVLCMFKGELGESTIISAIQSQETNFEGLLELKKGSVPSKIMDAVKNTDDGLFFSSVWSFEVQ